MEAISVAPVAPPPGDTTITLMLEDAHVAKLRRFRAVKRELIDLRREHDALQAELFGQPAGHLL